MGWRGFGPWRQELRAFVELFALCGVAVAQPTFDLLAKNAGLFVTLETSAFQTVVLALGIVVVPPLALWGVEVLIGLLVPGIRRGIHGLLAAGVIAVIATEVLKHQSDVGTREIVAIALLAGVAGGALVWRSAIVRLWLRFLAVAPALFALVFLFSSSVTTVVFDNGAASAAGVVARRPARIVMLVLDELPLESLLEGNGHVDAALFPHLGALSATSTWFRNHTTVAPYTDEAVPAILSGSYPSAAYQVPVASEYPHNLFTLLGGMYRMNVFESVAKLCPTGICAREHVARPNRFGELVDTTYSLWSEFASPKRKSLAINPAKTHSDNDPLVTASSFVRSLRPSAGPQLDFLHVLLPHQPWHLRGTGQDDGWHQASPGMAYELYWPTADNAATGRERHLLQVQAADRLVGQVVDRLRHLHEYDSSMIVVTADHGVAFSSGEPYRGASAKNYPEILWTPMFVKAPGQAAGTIVDRPTESVDVLPTIADLIGTKLPWRVDGHSMFDTRAPVRSPRLSPWVLNAVNPSNGADHVTFSGTTGYASVLRARASAATGAPALRIYRVGPFGSLIGRKAAPLVGPGSPTLTARLDEPRTLDHVDPEARSIPWAFVRGTLNAGRSGIPLAITVNGVVAGVAESSLEQRGASDSRFWSTLPPQLFQPGHDTIDVYAINGTAADPRLVPVRLG